ncbi:PREDICTED: dynamin-binding protein-like, partial [Merops nubicus]|uniref:dynamin-binding protein-like n=1 Tax=Merops nubicus TaxID=57421 RepID=UPI0004F055F4
MEAGSVVRAVFDFCPSVSEELPLFVGDVIEVLAVVDEFWLLGKKEGVTGQFPSSFVEPVDIPPLKQGEKLFVCTSDFTSQEPGSLSLQRGDLVVLGGSLASSWLQGRSSWGSKGFFPSSCVRELCLSVRSRQLSQTALLEVPAYSLGQARALMDLSAQLEEELDFREGDVINIVGVSEPGWFEGELRGRRGIFPEGFVELLTPLRASGTSVDPEPTGTCDTNGTVEMPPKEEEPGSTYGVALYQFQALESKELDFEVGDRIRIIGILEDGWLEGELRGKCGIFPHRFVKLEASESCREKAGAGDPQDPCRGQAISSNSWAASEPQESQSSAQDLDGWVDNQQKSKPCSTSLGGAQVGLDTWAGSWGECCPLTAQGDGCTDLDSKLTEQLAQFEKSLSSTGTEQDKVSRHFSILDYSSEKDIVRGSPECAPHARQPERRKALRPPPPRPSSLAANHVHTLGGQMPKGRSLSFSVKPSRPAPRPPASSQRKNAFPAQLQPSALEQRVEERHEDLTPAGSASPRSILLKRIGEVERDLEAYSKTRAELSLLLEEQQDELVRVETLENLDFCDSNIESLSTELQELRGSDACVSLGTGALERRSGVSPGLDSGSRESAPAPHPSRTMCTYPGTKHSVGDPRQGPRYLGWECEDCCAVRRGDVAGVAVPHDCSSEDGRASPGSGTCYTQSKMQDMEYDGCGELEGEVPGPQMTARSSGQAERSRVRTGRPDWSQVWEQEAEEENRVGSMLQRNSFYRRTAPSALRHSEFVQTRKEKR